MKPLGWMAAIAMLLASPAPSWAHPAPFSYIDLSVGRGTLDVAVVAHIFDVGHDLNIDPAERLLEPGYAASQARAIAGLLASRFTVTADGRTLVPQWSRDVDVLADLIEQQVAELVEAAG